MNFPLLTVLLFSATLAACHKGVERVEVPGDSVTPTQFVSMCDSKTNAYRAMTNLSEEKSVTVKIERKFQRSISKDCNGNITSDSIVTVKSPRTDFELTPGTPLSRAAKSVRLFNSETCEDRVAALPVQNVPVFGEIFRITGSANGTIQVKMDMAEAWFTYKVTSGWNHIYYTYDDGKDIASGVYNVFVDYTEETLPGQVVHEATDCAKPR